MNKNILIALPALSLAFVSCKERATTSTSNDKASDPIQIHSSSPPRTDTHFNGIHSPSSHTYNESFSYASLNNDMRAHYQEWDGIMDDIHDADSAHLASQRLHHWKLKHRSLQKRMSRMSLNTSQREQLNQMHQQRFGKSSTKELKSSYPSISQALSNVEAPLTKSSNSAIATSSKPTDKTASKVSSPAAPKKTPHQAGSTKSVRSFSSKPQANASSKTSNKTTHHSGSNNSSSSFNNSHHSSNNSFHSSNSSRSNNSSSSRYGSSSSRNNNRSTSSSRKSGSRKR